MQAISVRCLHPLALLLANSLLTKRPAIWIISIEYGTIAAFQPRLLLLLPLISRRPIPFLKQPLSAGAIMQSFAPLLGSILVRTNADGVYLYRFDNQAAEARLLVWAGRTPAGHDTASITSGHAHRESPIVLHREAWHDQRFVDFPEFAANRFEGVASPPPHRSMALLAARRTHRGGPGRELGESSGSRARTGPRSGDSGASMPQEGSTTGTATRFGRGSCTRSNSSSRRPWVIGVRSPKRCTTCRSSEQ